MRPDLMGTGQGGDFYAIYYDPACLRLTSQPGPDLLTLSRSTDL